MKKRGFYPKKASRYCLTLSHCIFVRQHQKTTRLLRKFGKIFFRCLKSNGLPRFSF